MSPVRHSGGESLQEMIDRYNRELLRMSGEAERGKKSEKPSPAKEAPSHRPPAVKQSDRLPRPEAQEPLYDRGGFLPRPEPREPLDEPDRPHAQLSDLEQGMRDMEQARRDREQGMRDAEQGERDRQQGMRDMEQAERDRQQGMKDREQGERDRRQGQREAAHGGKPAETQEGAAWRRSDLERLLAQLKKALEELNKAGQKPVPATRASHEEVFTREAVRAAARPESQREQWLRDLEQGRQELERGLRELEQGLRDREQGVRDYEQGIAEREYWLNRSRPAAAQLQRDAMSREDAPLTGQEGFGTLIVQAFTARQAEPVAGAQVVVTLPREDGELLFRVMETDEDGRTPPLRLPVDKAPEGAGYTAPFADYRVYVNAAGFVPSGGLTAQMFAGITSVLPVELVPGREGR